METYLKPYKWTYLNEVVERSNNTQQQTSHSRITNAISKPRHVLVGELIRQILKHKQQIHSYTTLLIYQTMLIYHVVISRLEMEMNTLIYTINQLQIRQEFTDM